MSRAQDVPASKTCAACGRTMEYRARWARNWDSVRYCSAACRRRVPGAQDLALEARIEALLRARSRGATICPSEASRAEFGQDGLTPARMQQTRYAANRLVAKGVIEVTQGGQVVDPSRARGPIRLRLVP